MTSDGNSQDHDMSENMATGAPREKGTVGETRKGLIEKIPAEIDLKLKVGGRPGRRGSIKQEAIRNAEKAITQFGDRYLDVAQGQVASLIGQYARLKAAVEEHAPLHELAMIAREIKGQAKTCGYGLLTQVGDSLYRFLTDKKHLSSKQMAFVEAHIGVIQNIVAHKLSGDGGPIGQELLRSLAVAKHKLDHENHK